MLVPHTHTHIYYISLKGVRKFKGLRLILVNSHIFKKKNFMVFVSIVVIATKYKEECHILTLLLLFQLKLFLI